MAYDLAYCFHQLRRIEQTRKAGFEKEIRRLYNEMLKEMQHFMADAYVRYARDERLDYGALQLHGQYARLLEEVSLRLDGLSTQAAKTLRTGVEEMYSLSFTGMADAVERAAGGAELAEILGEVHSVRPEVIRAAVENPVSGLTLTDTLNRHRQDIIYDVKRAVTVGMLNGDRYTTIAGRISKSVNGDYQKALRIARTETHRVREQGHYDGAAARDEKLKNANSDVRYYKIWRTAKDERVRPQKGLSKKTGKRLASSGKADHVKMEGVEILRDEHFDLGHGVKTLMPGSSGNAANDIHCRCFVEYVVKRVDEAEARLDKLNELEIQGGTDVQKTEVQKELDLIPEKHLALAEKQISGIEVVQGASGSSYNPKTRRIEISDAAPKGAVVHEVAHALERELKLYSNPAFRKVWMNDLQNVGLKDIIEDNKIFTKPVFRIENPKFVSPYQGVLLERYGIYDGSSISLEGLREYFSEGYKEFILNPDNLKRHDLQLYKYLESMI